MHNWNWFLKIESSIFFILAISSSWPLMWLFVFYVMEMYDYYHAKLRAPSLNNEMPTLVIFDLFWSGLLLESRTIFESSKIWKPTHLYLVPIKTGGTNCNIIRMVELWLFYYFYVFVFLASKIQNDYFPKIINKLT